MAERRNDHLRPCSLAGEHEESRGFVGTTLLVLVLSLALGSKSGLDAQGMGRVELSVQVSASVAGADAPPREVVLEVADPATREILASYVIEATIGEDQFAIDVSALESRSGWLVLARAPGWWSPAVHVAVDAREAALTLVREGVVRFALDGAGADLRAEDIWIVGRIHNRNRRRAGAMYEGIYSGPCESDLDSNRREIRIACPFARDEVADLRISMGPFLPLTRSDVPIAADTDLGIVEAVRGASISARLASGEALGQEFALLPDASLALPWSGWSDAGGFFKFEGLNRGSYELRLAGSRDDRWPVRIRSLADIVYLGELVSPAGSLLTVSLRLPLVELDGLIPMVRPVALSTTGAVEWHGAKAGPQEVRPVGSFIWRGLRSGDYELLVEDDRGNRWYRELIELTGSDHVDVALQAVPLRGRIERGSEPLDDVIVWFGALWGTERIAFAADDNGRFGGLLPREGYWSVVVTPSLACDPCDNGWYEDTWHNLGRREASEAGIIEVRESSDGIARVTIRLPSSGVSGRVVSVNLAGGTSSPAEGVRVWVKAVHKESEPTATLVSPTSWLRETAKRGTLEVSGLPAGGYEIHAEARIGERVLRSATQQLQVAEHEWIEDLELRLENRRALRVVVRAGTFPVGSAWTIANPTTTPSEVSIVKTRSDGGAKHWLPMSTQRVDVVILADGLGSVGRRFELPEHGPIEVELREARGDLRIPLGKIGAVVTPGGVAIPMTTFLSFGQVRRDGFAWIVDGLAPGSYLFCPVSGACKTAEVVPWAESRVAE